MGYARKAVRDGSTIDVVPMLMPETTFETEAIWFCPEAAHLEGLEQMPKLLGALHAAEHSLIALLPLWAMCDRWDIGGLSTNLHYQTGRPTIFVYDGHSGGVGITERGFDRFAGLGRGHGAHAAALPVRGRLPFVRAEPEVREPQRAARQGGSANPPREDARVVVSIPTAAVRLGSASDETEETVQYVALIYADEDVWSGFSEEEREAAYDKYRAFGSEAEAAGVLAGGNELGPTRDATTVRVRRRDPRHGWALCRGEGSARRLLHPRVCVYGRGARLGGADPGRRARRGRGSAGLRRSGGGAAVNYALLIYDDDAGWADLPDEERATLRAAGDAGSGSRSSRSSARPIRTCPARSSTAATPRRSFASVDGERIVTDGPFAETKEILGGVFLVDLPDLDEAIRLAALIPAAKGHGSIEIRPVLQ